MHSVVPSRTRGLLLVFLLSLVPPARATAQEQGPVMINRAEHPALRAFRWRSIGPAGQGGRVDDIAVSETDPRTFYVGFATGGL